MKSQLTQWSPRKEMDQIQNRLASLFNWETFPINGPEEALTSSAWSPRVDIVEETKEFVVNAELPEMKREDVKVTVEDRVLTIAGERKQEKEEKNRKFHRVEREYGNFVRSFILPDTASGERVTAEFKDGILKVHLPKDEKAPVKSVEIKVS
jgi:HSP20 family protein